jgi:hypothetical protein
LFTSTPPIVHNGNLPCFKAGILVINKVKPTIPIRTEVRLVFSEIESIKCASIFFDSDPNGYWILITEPVHIQDFCGHWSHLRDFLRVTSLEAGSMLIRDTLKVQAAIPA